MKIGNGIHWGRGRKVCLKKKISICFLIGKEKKSKKKIKSRQQLLFLLKKKKKKTMKKQSSNPGQALENPGNWQVHSLLTFTVQSIMTTFIKSGIILSTGRSWHCAMHTVGQDLYPKDLI